MLVDTAKIKVKAGKGGDGAVSFRREKYVPRGGPDGGNGGKGGDVIFVANHNLATLMDFRSQPNYLAENGKPGSKRQSTGASGKNLVVEVPVGTLIYQVNNEEILIADLDEDGKSVLICKGGAGGKGNTSFKSSTNQAPREFTPGKEGEEKFLKLEVKLIADVGLIGLPNAGKSTLINQLTKANAKVGNYPFTTLSPNLGICRLSGGNPEGLEIVVADIPGLIEGASKGKGLGDDFLRHVERTRVLVHVVDPLGEFLGDNNFTQSDQSCCCKGNSCVYVENSWKAYVTIRQELKDYGHDLAQKPEIVVINKMDITEVAECFEEIKAKFAKEKVEVLGISAYIGLGVGELKQKLATVLSLIPKTKAFEPAEVVKKYDADSLPNKGLVFNR